MSSENIGNIDPEEVSHEQLVTSYRAEKARREKLEEQVDELAAKIDRVNSKSLTKNVANQLIAALVNDNDVIDFAAEPMENREALSDFGLRVDTVETKVQQVSSKVDEVHDGSADGPMMAWKQIVEHANRMKKDPDYRLPENRVKLYKENIAHATGKTERHAGNYIEKFGEEKDGADWQRYKRATPGSNNSGRKKALIIDLDVWGDSNE